MRKLVDVEKDLGECVNEKNALRKRERGLEQKQQVFEGEMIALLRSIQFPCPDCGERGTLSKWIFIQTFRDDRMLNDRIADWKENHYTDCWVRCPKCGEKFFFKKFPHQNKLREFAKKIEPFYGRLSRLFGKTERMEVGKEEEVTAEMFSK